MQLNGCVSFHNMVINSTNEIVYRSVLSIVILGHPIRLEFCFHGKILHPIMNALKNSLKRKDKTVRYFKIKTIFSGVIPSPIHFLSQHSWTEPYSLFNQKITTEDIYFKNFNYKTLIYNLASEAMSQRVT